MLSLLIGKRQEQNFWWSKFLLTVVTFDKVLVWVCRELPAEGRLKDSCYAFPLYSPSALGEPGPLSMLGKHPDTQRQPGLTLPFSSVHSKRVPLSDANLHAPDDCCCRSWSGDASCHLPVFRAHGLLEHHAPVGGGWCPWAIRPDWQTLSPGLGSAFCVPAGIFQRTFPILVFSLVSFPGGVSAPGTSGMIS